MAWVFLFLAGLFEIGWAMGLKQTEGFTRFVPSLLTVVSMVLSIGLLNRVQFETRSASLPKPPMGEDLKRNLRVSNWTRFRHRARHPLPRQRLRRSRERGRSGGRCWHRRPGRGLADGEATGYTASRRCLTA